MVSPFHHIVGYAFVCIVTVLDDIEFFLDPVGYFLLFLLVDESVGYGID